MSARGERGPYLRGAARPIKRAKPLFTGAFAGGLEFGLNACPYFHGGGKGSRTPDLFNAIEALYQLSYTPNKSRTARNKLKSIKYPTANQAHFTADFTGVN